ATGAHAAPDRERGCVMASGATTTVTTTDRPLIGKVALVTGGAGGLGSAICRELAAAGANVLVADVRAGAASDLADSLTREWDCPASAAAVDVSDERQVEGALMEARQRFGGLDILINNAGIDRTVPVEELTAAQWD